LFHYYNKKPSTIGGHVTSSVTWLFESMSSPIGGPLERGL